MAQALLVNPRKRKGRKTGKTIARKSTVKKYRRKSNPARRGGIVNTTIMPAAISGAGAVGANLLFDYMSKYLPANFQTGNMRFLAEAGMIIGAGMLLDKSKVLDKKLRDGMVSGALTVTAFRAFDNMLSNAGVLNGYTSLAGYSNVNNLAYMNTAMPMKR